MGTKTPLPKVVRVDLLLVKWDWCLTSIDRAAKRGLLTLMYKAGKLYVVFS